VKYTLSILGIVLCLSASAQERDSIQRKITSSIRNPYRNVKSSLFVHSGYSGILGRNFSAGIEVRRFLSLREYLYFNVSYAKWTNNQDRLKNDVGQNCSYYLNSQTISLRTGLGIFGKHNLVLGTHYLMAADLKERVPSVLDPDTPVVLSGEISNYTRDFLPFIGYNVKGKLWQFVFLEFGLEFWIFNTAIFKPLEGQWRVPDNYSPLLSEDYDAYPYGYLTIHFKL
jgi:hypothetical protein